jgi:carbonic anhydrase/acetyltransferase-like protein (isoleucine patch superfamily)
MEDKKYELVKRDFIIHKGRKLYKIKALRHISKLVFKGYKGGYVEGYHNLSQKGTCWIGRNSKVYENAIVKDNAVIWDEAEVYGNAVIKNDAKVFDYSQVYGNAMIRDNAVVEGDAEVFGNAEISSRSVVTNNAKVYGNSRVIDEFDPFGYQCPKNSTILDNVNICGNSVINSSTLADNAKVYGNAKVNQVTARDNIKVYDNAVAGECKSGSFFFINDNSELYGNSSIILQDIGARFCGDTKIRDNSSINYFSKSIKLPKLVKVDVDYKNNVRDHEEKKV